MNTNLPIELQHHGAYILSYFCGQ